MKHPYIPPPFTYGGKTYWPVVAEGCAECAASGNDLLCRVLPTCEDVSYLDDTPESHARWVAQRLTNPPTEESNP